MAQRKVWRAMVPLAVVPVLALAACTGQSDGGGGGEPQTLDVLVPIANQNETYWADAFAAFEATHDGVKIEIEEVAGETYPTILTTRLQAGNAPDAFMASAGSGAPHSVIQLADAGLVLPLDNPDIAAGIPEGSLGLYTFDGTIYGIPVFNNVNGYIYNEPLAEELGISLDAGSTLEEFIEACGTAREAGKALVGLAGAAPVSPGILLSEIAASTVYGPEPDWDAQRAAGETTFADSPGWREAVEAVETMFHEGCFQDGAAGAGFDQLTNGMADTSLVGFPAPGGAAGSIEAGTGGAVVPVVLTIPAPQGTDTYLSLTSEISMAGSVKTDSPELVQELLAFLVSDEGSAVVAESAGSIPTTVTADTNLPASYDPILDLLAEGRTRGGGFLNWPNPAVYDALGSGITGIMTGQLTVDDVLESADAAWG